MIYGRSLAAALFVCVAMDILVDDALEIRPNTGK